MSESEDLGLPKWRPFNERPLSQILEDYADFLQGPRTVEMRFKFREAAAILKRYEDAPVGFVMGQGLLTQGAAAIVQTEKPGDVKGQRVRIVLDNEGV